MEGRSTPGLELDAYGDRVIAPLSLDAALRRREEVRRDGISVDERREEGASRLESDVVDGLSVLTVEPSGLDRPELGQPSLSPLPGVQRCDVV